MARARQYAALTVAGSSVLAVRARKRLGLPALFTTASAYVTPVAIAAGFRRSRIRDAAGWAAHMWAYKNAFELPNDDHERLQARAHFDYPIAVDRVLGLGTAPTQRLQGRLRRRGHLSVLDKALTFFYWTWEAEPHLVLAWIRWRRPESFAAAASRLAATFDLTLVAYWG